MKKYWNQCKALNYYWVEDQASWTLQMSPIWVCWALKEGFQSKGTWPHRKIPFLLLVIVVHPINDEDIQSDKSNVELSECHLWENVEPSLKVALCWLAIVSGLKDETVPQQEGAEMNVPYGREWTLSITRWPQSGDKHGFESSSIPDARRWMNAVAIFGK